LEQERREEFLAMWLQRWLVLRLFRVTRPVLRRPTSKRKRLRDREPKEVKKMALDQGVLDAVTNANFKSIAEMGTIDALGHRSRLNLLAEASMGQMLNRMNALDPAEAASISGVVSSDMAEKMGELSAAVANAQQLMKGAQTTLPETGQG